ncbi:MAG TPA: serine/threonine-protein kinase [Gemmatimonadales bacterium]|nr:serine/threonine-protein kinase [Gemmatimonadales bacterium]
MFSPFVRRPRISPLTEEFLSEVRRTLRGRYEVERPLGRGGMGLVYLARDIRLARPVAIKVLPPERAMSPVHRARFLREARIAARLSHPHIVPIFSVGELGDVVFFVMAYVPGYTLGHRIRTRGPLPAAETARVLRETALALAHAHDQGVVHRDVKPDNILIDGSTGSSFVTDFGIARFGIGPISGSRTVLGTPEFMSPEQARGLALDARSDLYSLGVVGYYAASGRLPFDAEDPYVVMTQHVTEVPSPLATVAPKTSTAVASLVDRCLEKNPDQRPQSGNHIADGLAAQPAPAPHSVTRIRKLLTLGRRWSVLAPLYLVAIGVVGLPLVLAQHLNLQGGLLIVVLAATWVALLPPLFLTVAQLRRLFRRIITLSEPDTAPGASPESA